MPLLSIGIVWRYFVIQKKVKHIPFMAGVFFFSHFFGVHLMQFTNAGADRSMCSEQGSYSNIEYMLFKLCIKGTNIYVFGSHRTCLQIRSIVDHLSTQKILQA